MMGARTSMMLWAIAILIGGGIVIVLVARSEPLCAV